MTSWKQHAYGRPVNQPPRQFKKAATLHTGPKVNLNLFIYKAVEFLREKQGHHSVSRDELERYLGKRFTALPGLEEELKDNPKICVKNGTYAYKAKYESIKNWKDLLREIDKTSEKQSGGDSTSRNGLKLADILDCYDKDRVKADVEMLWQRGAIIVIEDDQESGSLLYRRGSRFLTRLSGTVTVQQGKYSIDTSNDLTQQVRRGDGIVIVPKNQKIETMSTEKLMEHTFRVSFESDAKKGQDSLARRSQYSMTSGGHFLMKKTIEKERPYRWKKYSFLRTFDRYSLPLDRSFQLLAESAEFNAARGPHGHGLLRMPGWHVYKFGVTNDIRSLWSKTRDDLKRKSRKALAKFLQDHFKDEMGQSQTQNRRKRPMRARGRKKKKQRAMKNMTNEHLRHVLDDNS